jgi:hypothetical protein
MVAALLAGWKGVVRAGDADEIGPLATWISAWPLQ